ncbi:baculoviral IAP repeat-containing protein 2-like isoform X1 [Biomphalaria pfeifferi]|uniref:Baculoviral IAP repeat-containing protein 2-like isoform X1 n=1 Tax=Biomphalaria pfeifferi TaxID=112525 RepID=A0AAD8FHB0_BIOPF|nr:baculoviral IAP repeat-containing protein 2-like isoform X1 [Biomphalaria pfeifferi]
MTFPISSGKRLASFRPLLNSELPDFVSFTKLSSGGFFYPGNGLYVKCIGCDNLVEINRFENEPSSETYHKSACRFIQTESRENLHDSSVRPPSTQDVSASSSHRTDSLYQSTDHSPVNSDQLDQVPLTEGQISNEPPSHLPRPPTNSVYPVYSDAVKRLQSFATWPANHFLSINVLVNAGFFFAGYSDCVRCYSCGLGLRSWKPGDDVDVEHKRFRPSCSLLQLKQRNNVANNVASNVASNDPSVPARPIANGDAPTPDTAIRDSISITITEEQVPAQNVTSPLSTIHDLPPAPIRNGQPVASASQASSVQRDMRSVSDVARKLLQRENETLKQQMKCKSCHTADVQDLFLPCGHMSTCKQCSNKFSQCPACGKRILGTVNVYFA